MSDTKTTRGGLNDTMGDIDESSSLEQVSSVYKPSSAKDAIAGKDIDEGHGGINQTRVCVDGAASANKMTTHSTTAPTAEDLGIS